MTPRTVELALPMKTISRSRMLGMATLMVIVGAAALLLGLALLAMVLSGKGEPAMLVMETFLGLPGAFMVWHGIRQFRAAWGPTAGEVVKLSAPYAFRITDTNIEFPEFYGHGSETWRRASTTATAGSLLGFTTLTLEHPDRQRRRFFANGLVQPTEQVVQALEGHP